MLQFSSSNILLHVFQAMFHVIKFTGGFHFDFIQNTIYGIRRWRFNTSESDKLNQIFKVETNVKIKTLWLEIITQVPRA
jgi:hypothetical protein